MTSDAPAGDAPDPARWRLTRELFSHLADKSPSQRERHLSLVCEDDPALRREVEGLLGAHDALGESDVGERAPGLPVADEPPPPETIGDYVLLERLGSGGAGAVYLAEHPVHGEVALKLQPAAAVAGTTARRRFEQEAEALGSLEHPVLCALCDAFVTERYAVLAMERVRGMSLAERLLEGPFGWHESVAIVRPLIEALASAHARGILHRDVKPTNVMLDGEGRVRLIDFGIAKFADVRLTRTGQMIGSPRYMSPEQWLGLPLDARTDQFSLGLLWHEMLTGRSAFAAADEPDASDADDIAAIAKRVLTADPAPLPARGVDGVPLDGVAPLLGRMLAAKPAERFEDLAAVSRALDAAAQKA